MFRNLPAVGAERDVDGEPATVIEVDAYSGLILAEHADGEIVSWRETERPPTTR
ncbi:hypothetical protein GCM10009757_28100 [Streptomyces cheonanensis]|uniref:Uncharacterized protein n=1 Tax=Streptomyces cheonanensis TaxID=312720 RepID=A0ABP5GPJ7_9ACTN|nr:hypothetical protein [Streptomyces harbinensis]QKV70012.1 hypothetical protein HUT13_15440 [Streptomyces harbinensis]